jgi:hypothetical protein
MQQNDDLISVAAAARAIGVHRSTLSRQIAGGLLRAHAGKVRLSEVIADREYNVDLARSRRRGGHPDDVIRVATTRTSVAQQGDATASSATQSGSDASAAEGASSAYRNARAHKEDFTGKLRELEYQIKSGAYVEIETVARQVEAEYSTVRERFLAMPGKLASILVGRDRGEIEDALRKEVGEILEELHAPAGAHG